MKSAHWILFGLMVLAQLAVPLRMIGGQEAILREGAPYKFRCGPVDPYDFLRGRYVALSFPDLTIEDWRGPQFRYGEAAYARLGVGDDGFATVEDLTATPPASGDFLKVSAHTSGSGSRLWIQLPFDKYFMNEYDAPAAEIAYREQSRTDDPAWVMVRVQQGQGVIEGLYIGDVPIEEFIKQQAARTQ